MDQPIHFRCMEGFYDPRITPEIWNKLLGNSSTDVIFLTWQWQRAWWDVFGRGELLLIVAERDGQPITIAPLYADEGMIFFVGSGCSDFLNFIGDVSDPYVVGEILALAVRMTPQFVGLRFYHVSIESALSETLEQVSEQQGWAFYNEGEMNAPIMEMLKFPAETLKATQKRKIVRAENWFIANGELKTEHFHTKEDILPHLVPFFEQDIITRDGTSAPSPFISPINQLFFQHIIEYLSETGWLRFTCLLWNDSVISYHFGFNYKGSYLDYKASYDKRFAKHSPGIVLLKRMLLYAINEQAHTYDFLLGEEDFKNRFATNKRQVRNWGLYPQS